MRYVAYCTKGLEQVVSDEILAQICDAIIINQFVKYIVFESQLELHNICSLRTIDDLGLFLIDFEYPCTFSTVVSSLSKLATNCFSVTASIAGTTHKPADIAAELIHNIKESYGWEFLDHDHTVCDIRLFIDHDSGHLARRATPEPLSHRKYKTISRIGSLKASIAAAMIRLATIKRQNLKIIDMFCGSGTILGEALSYSHHVFGSDISAESVTITQKNLKNLGFVDEIKRLDATKTNWPSNFFDCAISNLPWDKQIEVSRITTLYEGTLREFKRILKNDGTICVLITKPELFIKLAKKMFPEHQVNLYPIGLLGQNPTIVLLTKKLPE